MSYTIYKHTSPSNKVYIGMTKQNPLKRWLNGHGYKSNPYFWRAIEKYNWNNFQHEIIAENLTKSEAEKLEIKLISQYRSNEPEYGYNIDNGGNCIGSFSLSHRKKISEANKGNKSSLGRIVSEETRRKISLGNKGKIGSNKGKHFSNEHKLKISLSQKGIPRDEKAVKVFCVELNKTFDKIIDAANFTKSDPSSIAKVCRNKRKTANGYHWRYAA